MREVDCPSLVFIDFNIPMVTPGHGVFWECSRPWALSSAKRARLLKVRVTVRLIVGQSVSLGFEPHELYSTVWQLQSFFSFYGCVCVWGAPFMRGWVCLLYMLLAFASTVFFGSESQGTHGHILLFHFFDFPFHCLLWLAGSWYLYSTLPPHGYAAGVILYIAFTRTHAENSVLFLVFAEVQPINSLSKSVTAS
jgi:hypothetical protein